jgi:RNA recognition motif-containing protein
MNGNSKIFIGNLSYSCTQLDITALVEEFGPVKEIFLPINRESCQFPCSGFCFVTFVMDDSARRAIDDLNGRTFQGRTLKVDFARPRQPLGGGYDRRTLAGGD